MKIGIIGCGHMGSSIAKQLARSHHVAIYDHNAKRLRLDPAIKICHTPQECLSFAEIIILAFKPRDLKHAAEDLRAHLEPHHILVSVLAGVSQERLKEVWKTKNTIVRIMPNLAVEYGKGVIGCADSSDISAEVKENLTQLFSPLGLTLWLPEDKMNGITALAGSGPAFILIFIEAMIDAGIALGFNSEEAKTLVLNTIVGTLSLLEQTGKHPGELCWQISSPAGTTVAGKIALENAGVRSGIIHTFLAAYKRAKEIGD